MARADRIRIIREIEQRRDSTVFCLLTSDRPGIAVQLQKDILPRFVSQLRRKRDHRKIDLFIFTHGGDTLAGFGLSRLFREYAEHVGVLVAHNCHSAGTLIALGANEIIMTRAATLSPIDPSITTPLNPAIQTQQNQPPQLIPLSVESVAGFESLIKSDWKITGHDNITQLMRILTEKVHPLALGDVFRARQQIELLAKELLRQHRHDEKNIKKIIHTLSKGLGSHDYLIFRREAKKLMGQQIVGDEAVEDLIWELYMDFSAEMQLGVPFDRNLLLSNSGISIPQPLVQPFARSVPAEIKLVLIESAEQGDQAVRRLTITESVMPNGAGVQRNIMSQDQFAGWEIYA